MLSCECDLQLRLLFFILLIIIDNSGFMDAYLCQRLALLGLSALWLEWISSLCRQLILVILATAIPPTFSHCFALRAPFNLVKKLDCPPFLNDNRICFDEDDSELLFVELEELELVVAVGTISRGKSAPHISH